MDARTVDECMAEEDGTVMTEQRTDKLLPRIRRELPPEPKLQT